MLQASAVVHYGVEGEADHAILFKMDKKTREPVLSISALFNLDRVWAGKKKGVMNNLVRSSQNILDFGLAVPNRNQIEPPRIFHPIVKPWVTDQQMKKYVSDNSVPPSGLLPPLAIIFLGVE